MRLSFNFWQRFGVIHAHPINIISHLLGLPLLAYFLWQHNLTFAIFFGFLPTTATVIYSYLTWKDKRTLSKTELFLYERSTQSNFILISILVFVFLFALWFRNFVGVVITILMTFLILFNKAKAR